jgi:hypothetical protein
LQGIGIERPGAVIAPLIRSAMEIALARTNPDTLNLAALADLIDQGDGFGSDQTERPGLRDPDRPDDDDGSVPGWIEPEDS